ncbi:MAG: dephospho-CoA kinase [Rhodospirillales bacterium]|jgi:dephospho-CoA kinase|tara:strand:+ start:399 stop:1007 length:609 start_codon:yes stop_codon:yes gene_type:complete
MVILGLTGSIGMGKSTAAADFRRLRVAVHDADETVHALMAPGGAAFDQICQVFPGVRSKVGIDRKRLGDLVFADMAALKKLEAILHPLVRKQKTEFLKRSALRRQNLVVLDVPLLFETGGEAKCDAVVVVTAPTFVQRARVMARPGMTTEKFESILAKQVPDLIKRRSADFVVQTGLGRIASLRKIRHIAHTAPFLKPNKWP